MKKISFISILFIILSTAKFCNAAEENFKLYKDSLNKYEFTYPEDWKLEQVSPESVRFKNIKEFDKVFISIVSKDLDLTKEQREEFNKNQKSLLKKMALTLFDNPVASGFSSNDHYDAFWLRSNMPKKFYSADGYMSLFTKFIYANNKYFIINAGAWDHDPEVAYNRLEQYRPTIMKSINSFYIDTRKGYEKIPFYLYFITVLIFFVMLAKALSTAIKRDLNITTLMIICFILWASLTVPTYLLWKNNFYTALVILIPFAFFFILGPFNKGAQK